MPDFDASTQSRQLAQLILDACLPCLAAHRLPFVLGLSGLQGSGKSTLARALTLCARRIGFQAQRLSLDDVYFGHRARKRLAASVHPLLATRGVPGTHDTTLLLHTLDAMQRASPRHPARLPRFDKGRDTRRSTSHWPRVTQVPDLLVLEGWCLGLDAQAPEELREPINTLESGADPDGRWRRHVNDALVAMQTVWQRLDRLVVLAAPDWETACRWRARAEAALRARHATRAMSPAQLRRFMMHFERLSRHALRTLPAQADLCLDLDQRHRLRRVRTRTRNAEG